MPEGDFDQAIDFCRAMVQETEHFGLDTFRRLAEEWDFHLDKVPVGPQDTDQLESVGGYPAELLNFVRELGGRTLNSACFFGPNVFLSETVEYDYIQTNLGVGADDLRVIGGDHGEGRWVLLTASGRVIFMEVDDDYSGRIPDPCFENFVNWFRTNFVLGLVEDQLERHDIDVSGGVPREFSRRLLETLSPIDLRLTAATWPYDLLYKLKQ